MAGKLVLLGLPIGNLGDITTRSLEALKDGQVFFTEDTRNLKKLMGLYSIELGKKVIKAFHDHSKIEDIEADFCRYIERGDVYYASEAGSPSISDPAHPLVKLALTHDVEVDLLPGVSALTGALEISGLPPNPIHFHGFFPRSEGDRQRLMEVLAMESGTIILFESPDRLSSALKSLCTFFPEGRFCVVRELTKKFQSVYRFSGEDFLNGQAPAIKCAGEVVLLFYLERKTQGRAIGNEHLQLAEQVLAQKAKPKSVAKLLASILGRNTSDIYSELIK